MKILAKFYGLIPPLLLFTLSLLIVLKSYAVSTILSGWDTLHPEFDFVLYFRRILAVWQPHQGLGAPPSQAHLSDLPRVFILWLMSFILPLNALRYAYILSMLIIGPLGVYFFLKQISPKGSYNRQLPAFLAAVVYLLNYGTLQHFYTPLEMFVTFYGFVGWFFYSLVLFLKQGKKKNIALLVLSTILLTPSAHTATLWYVFYAGLIMFLFFYSFKNRLSAKLIRKSLLIILLIFFLNAYWILPNLYYVKNYSKDVVLSKTHRLLSNEFFLRGQKRGTLTDQVLLTNFPFDWQILDYQSKQMVAQMGEFTEQVKKPFVVFWGYAVFVFIIAGLVYGVVLGDAVVIGLLPVFLLSWFFLFNANPPLGGLFMWLRDRLPLVQEAFRFPFTKFSLYLMLVYSVYFAYGISLMGEIVNRLSKNRLLFSFLVSCLFIGQIGFILPVFETGIISPYMKVSIPKEYFELFAWFKNEPKERILKLPLNSADGWVYHSWGYQGAGFLWFGLEQPLLDREFDRWYPYNEQAYREFAYALYSQDRILFEKLLEKYRIGYVLVDESVIDVDFKNSSQANFFREAERLFAKSNKLKKSRQFNFLKLYEVDGNTVDKNLREVLYNIVSIFPSYRWAFKDQAYFDWGNYVEGLNKTPNVYYPFRSFLNSKNKLSENIEIDIKAKQYRAYLKDLPTEVVEFFVPSFASSESYIFANLYVRTKSGQLQARLQYFLPDILLGTENIYPIKVEKPVRGAYRLDYNGRLYLVPFSSIDSNWVFIDQVLVKTREQNNVGSTKFIPELMQTSFLLGKTSVISGKIPQRQFSFSAQKITQLGEEKHKDWSKKVGVKKISYSSRDKIIGDSINLTNLTHEMAYIFAFEAKNIAGLPLRICMFNLYSRRCDIYDELSKHKDWGTDIFVLPSMKQGAGYRLDISNIAFGTLPSINELRKVTIIPLPYDFLKQIYLKTQNTGINVLFYNQAYEKNWRAYLVENPESGIQKFFPFWFGKELKDHVVVNNWGNGWLLKPETKSAQSRIVIVFLPQYLVYIGFGLMLFGCFAFLYRESTT